MEEGSVCVCLTPLNQVAGNLTQAMKGHIRRFSFHTLLDFSWIGTQLAKKGKTERKMETSGIQSKEMGRRGGVFEKKLNIFLKIGNWVLTYCQLCKENLFLVCPGVLTLIDLMHFFSHNRQFYVSRFNPLFIRWLKNLNISLGFLVFKKGVGIRFVGLSG